MHHTHRHIWPVPLIFLFILASCATTEREVTVVDRDPGVTETDTLRTPADEERILRIGELNPVKSLDPLYALNTTSRRTVLQLYEGLVRLDEHNEVKPAGARSWEISDDSLTYTFTLNRNVFFHDNEVFPNGRGRRVRAEDYEQIFYRMTSPEVPSVAAELFMDDIRGFEDYYREQREVFFEEDRFVDSIDGIRVENDTTLTFELNEPSASFLKKLATPFAVVYPQEAVRNRTEGLRRNPVGTGPFSMDSVIGDSIFVMQGNEDYIRRGENDPAPEIDRLEILHIPDEIRLYQQLSLENLDMIVDLGPRMIGELVDETGELTSTYRDQYRLVVSDRSEPIRISYNENNRFRLTRDHAQALAAQLSEADLIDHTGIASLSITRQFDSNSTAYFEELKERFPESEADEPLPIAFQRDTDVGMITGELFAQLSDMLEMSFEPSRVRTRNIFMFVDRPMLAYPGQEVRVTQDELLRLRYDRYLITSPETEGVRLNDLAWWLDLTHVQVPKMSDPEL